MKKILFNLISGQIFPNYFLIKHIKPDKCVNFYTEETEYQNVIFKNVLTGLDIEEVEVTAFDFYNCYNVIKNYVEKYISNSLILNFTGGTKIMSSAAFCVFKEKKLAIKYLDSQNNKVISLENGCQNEECFCMNISVEDYFKLTDQSIDYETPNIKSEDNEDRVKFRRYMEKNYPKIEALFIQLAVKSGSEKRKWRKEDHELNVNNNKLIYTASNKKYEIITNDNEKFILYNDDAFYYITGGWMENLVYEKIKNSKVYYDIRSNFKVNWAQKNTKNEFDIVATKNHFLHIFEVKSGELNSDMILKLNSLNLLYGGLYSKSYVITYFDLGEKHKELLSRANEYKIKIIKLSDLENFLKNL